MGRRRRARRRPTPTSSPARTTPGVAGLRRTRIAAPRSLRPSQRPRPAVGRRARLGAARARPRPAVRHTRRCTRLPGNGPLASLGAARLHRRVRSGRTPTGAAHRAVRSTRSAAKVSSGNSGGPMSTARRVLTTVFASEIRLGPAGGLGVPNEIVADALDGPTEADRHRPLCPLGAAGARRYPRIHRVEPAGFASRERACGGGHARRTSVPISTPRSS